MTDNQWYLLGGFVCVLLIGYFVLSVKKSISTKKVKEVKDEPFKNLKNFLVSIEKRQDWFAKMQDGKVMFYLGKVDCYKAVVFNAKNNEVCQITRRNKRPLEVDNQIKSEVMALAVRLRKAKKQKMKSRELDKLLYPNGKNVYRHKNRSIGDSLINEL